MSAEQPGVSQPSNSAGQDQNAPKCGAQSTDVSGAPMPNQVVPLPPAGLSRMMGLLEMIDDHGGRDDIYRIAHEIRDSFGGLLAIIKGAEVLGFVDTPGGDVVLLPLGKKLIEVSVNEKKRLIGERIAVHPTFAYFRNFLLQRPEQCATRQEIMEELIRVLPTERPKPQFDTLLNWGRYAEIFHYSRDEDRFQIAKAKSA